MREIWEEKFAPECDKTDIDTIAANMKKFLDKSQIGKEPDHSELTDKI